MAKRRALPAEDLINATVDSVKGMSIREIQAKHELSQRAARHIAQAANLTKEEYLGAVQADLMAALGQVAERLANEIDNLSTVSVRSTAPVWVIDGDG